MALGKTGDFDFVITEIGGVVGDIESLPFLEAVRQLRWELEDNCLCLHLTYVPYINAAKELKTKPTQHSVKQLQQLGIQPDVLCSAPSMTFRRRCARRLPSSATWRLTP